MSTIQLPMETVLISVSVSYTRYLPPLRNSSLVHPVIFFMLSTEYISTSGGHSVSVPISSLIGLRYFEHTSSEVEM